MYCPSCGSNNQEELNFCTRCGTNLGVVSNALAGKPTTGLETNERTAGLLKDFYRGRTMTLIGAAGSALSLFKLAGVFLLGFPETKSSLPVSFLNLSSIARAGESSPVGAGIIKLPKRTAVFALV